MQDIIKYVMGEAAKSNVEKRKVGCVIIEDGKYVVGGGYNTEEVHAEAMACEEMIARAEFSRGKLKAYVSHQPCPECAAMLLDHNVTDVEVITEFMKFDGDKLRYDLVSPGFMRSYGVHITLTCDFLLYLDNPCGETLTKAIDTAVSYYASPADFEEGVAKVLTFGARKYKPNNWRKCTDTGRYVAAAIRHLLLWEAGEENDTDSGLSHLDHFCTNLMFLGELGYVANKDQ